MEKEQDQPFEALPRPPGKGLLEFLRGVACALAMNRPDRVGSPHENVEARRPPNASSAAASTKQSAHLISAFATLL
jgi:hypothetical protein